MARKKTPRSPTAVNLAGQLGDALFRHAAERMRHFFLFLFAVDAACKLVNAELGTNATGGALIQEAATHQIDSGLRSKNALIDVFDETQASMVQMASTSFTSIDAAHYCNLGLKASPWSQLTSLAESLKEDHAITMVENAEVFTGNTVWLPQRVNIGPDRIIDQLHYSLAKSILGDGKPVFSLARAMNYAAEATNAIMAYAATLQGKAGLVACCNSYVKAYAKEPVEEIATIIGFNISAECDAHKMKVGDYIG